ncbi:helix-turn-helix domain-containing protein [Clostridium sp. CF012]
MSQLERGLTTVAVDSLINIAKALDVTLSYFLDEPKYKGFYYP